MNYLERLGTGKRKIQMMQNNRNNNISHTVASPANGGAVMHITYKKLFKLLIDRDMNRQDLKKLCGLSSASIAKLGKGENITTDVLVRICEGLDCDISDICEMVKSDDAEADRVGENL